MMKTLFVIALALAVCAFAMDYPKDDAQEVPEEELFSQGPVVDKTPDIEFDENTVSVQNTATTGLWRRRRRGKGFTSFWRRRRRIPRSSLPSSFKEIACPVMRGLVGSGFIEQKRKNEVGTYWASAQGTLNVIKDVLGFDDATMAPFKGILKKTGRKGTDVFQKKQTNKQGEWNLNAMHKFLGHAASTGVIGSATTGSATDNNKFNAPSYKKLMSHATSKWGHGFSARNWGGVCNEFANRALNKQNGGTNMAWKKNKLSWGILTLELSNTFAAFNNQFILGLSHLKNYHPYISKVSVQNLYKDSKLPIGFIPANGRTRITQKTLLKTVKDMEINAPCKVINAMRAIKNTKTCSGTKKHPDNSACVATLLTKNYCGANFVNCGCHLAFWRRGRRRRRFTWRM